MSEPRNTPAALGPQIPYAPQLIGAVVIGAAAACTAIVESKSAVVAACLLLTALLATVWMLAGPERWIPFFFGAAILLPPLPIALGDSGPHVAAAIALIGLMAGIAYADRWRMSITRVHSAIFILTTVMLASVASAALYSGAAIALGSLARVLLFGISGYVFFYTVSMGGLREDRFPPISLLFTAAVLAAAFACADYYFQFPAPAGFSPQFIWLDSGVYRRAQGLFYEASTLGNFCAFFLTMIAVSIFRSRKDRPIHLPSLVVGGAVLTAALALSYSRASVINIVVSLTALWALQRKSGSIWKTLLTLAGSAAAAGWAGYALAPEFFRAYGFRIWYSLVYSTTSTNGVLSGRLDGWRTILDYLAEHPWSLLLGLGYKTLPYSGVMGKPVIADNAYLSALAETGLVGLAALLFFLYAVLREGYRAARDEDQQRSFFGAWTFCFWCGQAAQMLSGDLLTYWRVLPIYLWVLALAMR
jgi:O-antigen ligase